MTRKHNFIVVNGGEFCLAFDRLSVFFKRVSTLL